MKLCFAYPNENNYSETFIRNHYKYLNPEYSLTGGWRPYKTKDNKSIFDFFLSEPIRIFLKRLLPNSYDKFYTKYLTKYLVKNKITVVLAEYGITGTCMMQACKNANVALIVHFHGFDASDRETLQPYEQKYKLLFQNAKAICVVSKDMGNKLVTLGADITKIHNIPYGVDATTFQPKTYSNGKIIIAVGRFAHKKAPYLTIKAFALVLKKEPNAILWMVGIGELLEECKQLTKELGISEKILFLGIKSPEEVAELLHQADIFVQHSMENPFTGDSEGTPNSILEACAVGLPIVSTYHAGIKEAVTHERTGFLVNEGDFEKMAEYIILLLDNPDLREQLGRNGREKISTEYNIETQIEKIRKLLI